MPATLIAPKRKITTTKTRRTLMSVLPDLDGRAAAACGRGAGVAGLGCGVACRGVWGRGGPEAGLPHRVQNPWPSASGLPQFLQKPAIFASVEIVRSHAA